MDTADMRYLRRETESLLAAHIKGWRFDWNNSPITAGLCSYTRKTIFLSAPIAELNSLDAFLPVPLHEISHSFNPGQGHNKIWRAACLALGGDGKRLHSLRMPPEPWHGYCLCPRVVKRYRRSFGATCGKCGDSFEWYAAGA